MPCRAVSLSFTVYHTTTVMTTTLMMLLRNSTRPFTEKTFLNHCLGLMLESFGMMALGVMSTPTWAMLKTRPMTMTTQTMGRTILAMSTSTAMSVG